MSLSPRRLPRRPPGWTPPGPQPLGEQGDPHLTPDVDEDLSFLAGDWRIFQPKKGHRWSLDDLLTAYVAVDVSPPDGDWSAVDLGCGLGSVLMLVAWALPKARVFGVEAQETRASRARRSLRYNGASDRCTVLDGDIRDDATLTALSQLLDGKRPLLVTGTPPYFELEATKLSSSDEAAACRAEVRGGLEVYLEAARTLLDVEGSLVMCYPHFSAERAREAAWQSDLDLVHRLTVIPAEGKPPLIVVDRFRCVGSGERAETHAQLLVRDARGQWTEEFRAIRRRFGMPDRPPR